MVLLEEGEEVVEVELVGLATREVSLLFSITVRRRGKKSSRSSLTLFFGSRFPDNSNQQQQQQRRYG